MTRFGNLFQRRPTRAAVAWAGLFLGPSLAGAAYLWLPAALGPAAGDPGTLTAAGRSTAAVGIWMACWWLTEAVPLAVTALLPLVLFPLLGVGTVDQAAAPYSRSLIFLFMGGFVLGLGMQRWGLHRRIALHVLLRVGTEPTRLVAGFMLATALLSMWISNTATVIMMLPIGASVLQSFQGERRGPAGGPAFGTALMLGIAYAASIGGIGTLIGTPPNLVLAAYLRDHYGVELTMLGWMKLGLPLVFIFLPLAWLYLTRAAFPLAGTALAGGREVLSAQARDLGPMNRGERIVLAVFTAAAAGWILRPQLVQWTGWAGLSDPVIAMAAALSLFVLPVDLRTRTFAMDWATARTLPWDILILFGGGLSLAGAIAANGVDAYIGAAFLGLQGVAPWLLILAVTAVVIFLTEITSNTAVTTTLLPVLAATAAAMAIEPGLLLTAATLAASCAFMLPVATPPNAIVFASGCVTVSQMALAGFALNLAGIVLVTLLVILLGPVAL